MPAAQPRASRTPAPATAGEMLEMARGFLLRKDLEDARLEAELLVAHALDMDRLGLFMALDRSVSGDEVDRARDLLVRRGRREPTAYIIGRREFYGRNFAVCPDVLIPRPETELLVDRVRELVAAADPSAKPTRIAELGTGSGCVAVTLALELPDACVTATDNSADALARAGANAEALGARVCFLEGDGLAPLLEVVGREGLFDLLVSNPPYVGTDERDALAPEVVEHEPQQALFAPEGDRDHWVRLLVTQGLELIAPGGHLLVELGAEQGSAAASLCEERGEKWVLVPDLAGVDRVLQVSRPS